MTDIEDWIRVHDEEPSAIARSANLEASVVHLVAVMVLAGVEDDQISDQLHNVAPSLDAYGDPLAGAPRAQEAIHRLAHLSPDAAGDDTRRRSPRPRRMALPPTSRSRGARES